MFAASRRSLYAPRRSRVSERRLWAVVMNIRGIGGVTSERAPSRDASLSQFSSSLNIFDWMFEDGWRAFISVWEESAAHLKLRESARPQQQLLIDDRRSEINFWGR